MNILENLKTKPKLDHQRLLVLPRESMIIEIHSKRSRRVQNQSYHVHKILSTKKDSFPDEVPFCMAPTLDFFHKRVISGPILFSLGAAKNRYPFAVL